MITIQNIKTGAEYQLTEAEFTNLQDYDRRWRHKYKIMPKPQKPVELNTSNEDSQKVEKQKVTQKSKSIENLDK